MIAKLHHSISLFEWVHEPALQAAMPDGLGPVAELLPQVSTALKSPLLQLILPHFPTNTLSL